MVVTGRECGWGKMRKVEGANQLLSTGEFEHKLNHSDWFHSILGEYVDKLSQRGHVKWQT